MVTKFLSKLFNANRCNERGVTLIELMISMLIFLMLSAGSYAALRTGEDSWQVNDVQIQLQQDLRKAMDGMINDLREAGSSSILDVPANGTWYTTITFKVPSGVTAGSVTWNANNIVFARGGTGLTQLRRTQNGQITVLAQNIQTVRFRRQAATPDELDIALVAQRNTLRGVAVDYQLDFDVQLRN